MKSFNIILSGESEENRKLIISLAKKLGFKTAEVSEEQLEDIGMVKAIEKGRTKEYVDTDNFLKSLK